MTFNEWYLKYNGDYGINWQSCRDGWNAALEEAAGAFTNAYHEAQREGCDANGAFDCGMWAIDALKEKP